MKKSTIEKKTKFTTNTYMRESLKYEIKIISEEDYFVTIKKYLSMSDKFIINNTTLLDNNYYLIEITPLKEKYNIRFYIDDKLNIVDYYIDITYENGIKYKIPYYVDLYLDIVHYPERNENGFCDEDELKEALDQKLISKKDYDMAYKVGNKLLKEIKNNTNKYLNIDILKYIKETK